MSYDLLGKVAIVTGSSSGLGESIAVHFAKWGASVTLCGRDQQRLEAVRQKCVDIAGDKSGRFLAVRGDMGDTTVRNRVVDETVTNFGRLDIVVANHGEAVIMDQFETATEEKFDRIINSNVKSTMFLLQRATPHLVKTKGSIVTMSSVGSDMCLTSMLSYCMAKSALDHLAKSISITLGPKGVRVNNVRPGVFFTRATRDFSPEELELRKDALTTIPVGRVGECDEVAHTVGFLVSDGAKYVHGADIDIDGGVKNVNPFTINFSSFKQ